MNLRTSRNVLDQQKACTLREAIDLRGSIHEVAQGHAALSRFSLLLERALT